MQSISGFFRRYSLLIAIFSALLGPAAPASAQDIVVVGNTRGDTDMIRSYFAGTSPA